VKHVDPTPDEPLVSPDGRFEAAVQTDVDRWDLSYTTILTDRATGERLFTCAGAPRVEWVNDPGGGGGGGGLTIAVHYPGYEPDGLLIDPLGRTFRLRTDEPWLPLAAWPLVEGAYGRGWAEAMQFRLTEHKTPFPWATLALTCLTAVALAVLALQRRFTGPGPIVLMFFAFLAFLLFGWLAATDVRSWTVERRWTLSAVRLSNRRPQKAHR
jgi:hypothetical protein